MFEEGERRKDAERIEFGVGLGLFARVGLICVRLWVVWIFEVGTFFDNVLHHAAEKVGLEGAKLIRRGFNADFNANGREWEGIFEIRGSDNEACAIEIIGPTGVGVASFDELGGGMEGKGFQSALDGFEDFAVLFEHESFFGIFGIRGIESIFFSGERWAVGGGAGDDIGMLKGEPAQSLGNRAERGANIGDVFG